MRDRQARSITSTAWFLLARFSNTYFRLHIELGHQHLADRIRPRPSAYPFGICAPLPTIFSGRLKYLALLSVGWRESTMKSSMNELLVSHFSPHGVMAKTRDWLPTMPYCAEKDPVSCLRGFRRMAGHHAPTRCPSLWPKTRTEPEYALYSVCWIDRLALCREWSHQNYSDQADETCNQEDLS